MNQFLEMTRWGVTYTLLPFLCGLLMVKIILGINETLIGYRIKKVFVSFLLEVLDRVLDKVLVLRKKLVVLVRKIEASRPHAE